MKLHFNSIYAAAYLAYFDREKERIKKEKEEAGKDEREMIAAIKLKFPAAKYKGNFKWDLSGIEFVSCHKSDSLFVGFVTRASWAGKHLIKGREIKDMADLGEWLLGGDKKMKERLQKIYDSGS